VFGGRPLSGAALPASARAGGRPLHLTFDLDVSDRRLGGLGITSVDRLAILASYHLEPRSGALVVRHLDRGRRLEIVAEPAGKVVHVAPDELPQLPVDLEPLSDAEVAAELLDDYPEGHGPLHQVGGRPAWPRTPVSAPRCPVTGTPMAFVAMVDSMRRFPTGGAEARLDFGDDGVLYVFWSDRAAISACLTASR
jgi:hypothetical protein